MSESKAVLCGRDFIGWKADLVLWSIILTLVGTWFLAGVEAVHGRRCVNEQSRVREGE